MWAPPLPCHPPRARARRRCASCAAPRWGWREADVTSPPRFLTRQPPPPPPRLPSLRFPSMSRICSLLLPPRLSSSPAPAAYLSPAFASLSRPLLSLSPLPLPAGAAPSSARHRLAGGWSLLRLGSSSRRSSRRSPAPLLPGRRVQRCLVKKNIRPSPNVVGV